MTDAPIPAPDDITATPPAIDLAPARDAAREVRALYEVLENRINGQVWTTHELLLGFLNDTATIGRLVLANDGTWDIDGDPKAELEHKLAESMWWIFVLADRLDIDMTDAYTQTMAKIQAGLAGAVTPEG